MLPRDVRLSSHGMLQRLFGKKLNGSQSPPCLNPALCCVLVDGISESPGFFQRKLLEVARKGPNGIP